MRGCQSTLQVGKNVDALRPDRQTDRQTADDASAKNNEETEDRFHPSRTKKGPDGFKITGDTAVQRNIKCVCVCGCILLNCT